MGAAVCAWLLIVSIVVASVMLSGNAPRVSRSAPAAWPQGSAMARDASHPTMVVLAHASGPRTGAMLTELAKIVGAAPEVTSYVVLLEPETGGSWTDGEIAGLGALIPGAKVVRDAGGAETRRFGARASGQVLVYDTTGDLAFKGSAPSSREETEASAMLLGALKGQSRAAFTKAVALAHGI